MSKQTLLAAAQFAFPHLSKDEVYAAIACGEVFVNGERVRDHQAKVSSGSEILRRTERFVSRGGLKLEHALNEWKIDVNGKVLVDAGSSTGGFTDCLLQHGASCVHAVDVGTNQLAYRLRSDPRVVVHERTSIMDVESLDPAADSAVADLSFRSLSGAASHLLELSRDGWAIGLVKPQFELKGPEPGFDGVIRDVELLRTVLEGLIRGLWNEGAYPGAILESPILGRRGNREFLLHLRRSEGVTLDEMLERAAALVYP